MSHAEHSHGIGQSTPAHIGTPGAGRGGLKGAGRGLFIGIALNLAIVAAEVTAGLVAGSLGLLSDAVHNFTDMAALAIAGFALMQIKKPPTAAKTFGYHRTGILAALINAVAMVVVTLWIFYEAWQRLLEPPPVTGGLVIITAAVALAANLMIVAVLKKRSSRDLNIRAAVLHLLGDAATSAAVVVSGIIIMASGWYPADPIVSIVLGLAILWGAWHIIKETLEIFLEESPRAIDVELLVREMKEEDGVRDIHDMHVWTLGSEVYALSCHVLIDDVKVSESTRILCDLKELLERDFGIFHSTLEVEAAPCEIKGPYCDIHR